MIVSPSIWIVLLDAANDQRSIDTVSFLVPSMSMVEVSSLIFGLKRVAKLLTEWNRTLQNVYVKLTQLSVRYQSSHLSQIRNAVHVLRSELAHAMPVN